MKPTHRWKNTNELFCKTKFNFNINASWILYEIEQAVISNEKVTRKLIFDRIIRNLQEEGQRGTTRNTWRTTMNDNFWLYK